MYFSQVGIKRMALRILLADESSTIKKAIQMALSEYGPEVKSVPSGLDVLSVTHTFRPEIILIDTLLTKKNGYEVCTELKADPQTAKIPVVLMWSNFIQLDQAQAAKAKADDSLEKPFDTETLRALIEKLVPKTKSHPLKNRLSHPALPDFVESDTFVRQKSQYLTAHSASNPASNPTSNSSGSIKSSQVEENSSSSEDDVDQFSHKPLTPQATASANSITKEAYTSKVEDSADEWSAQSPSQFLIETEDQGDFEEVTVVSAKGKMQHPAQLQNHIHEQINTYLKDTTIAQNKSQQLNLGGKPLSNFEEQLLKEEIKLMAERICWQVIPDLAEKIIREEVQKLMQNVERDS